MNDFHFTNANTHYFFVYVEVQKEPKRRQHFAYWLLDLTEEDPWIDIQKLTVLYTEVMNLFDNCRIDHHTLKISISKAV